MRPAGRFGTQKMLFPDSVAVFESDGNEIIARVDCEWTPFSFFSPSVTRESLEFRRLYAPNTRENRFGHVPKSIRKRFSRVFLFYAPCRYKTNF